MIKYSGIFILSSLALFPILFFHHEILEVIFFRINDVRYGSLLSAFFLFFLPTTLMGMITPYSVRLITFSAEKSGVTSGHIYFISTLGSTLGTIATSFYLILWFEIDLIISFVFWILFFSGLITLLVSLFQKSSRSQTEIP